MSRRRSRDEIVELVDALSGAGDGRLTSAERNGLIDSVAEAFEEVEK